MDQLFRRDVLFARMTGICAPTDLENMASKRVAVPGCGGVGFTHAESLVRMGVGAIHIADFDAFEAINVGRQFGATMATVGRRKVEVLEERLRSINPDLKVRTFDGISAGNIAEFLEGVDLVCDAIDYFSINVRRLLYCEARSRGIPAVIAGPIGFGAALFFFDPHAMSFDDYFDLGPAQEEGYMLRRFGVGLMPGRLYRHSLDGPNLDFETKSGSVLSSTCLLCTALVGVVALASLLKRTIAIKPVPYVYQIDIAAARFEELLVPDGVRGIEARPEAYLR